MLFPLKFPILFWMQESITLNCCLKRFSLDHPALKVSGHSNVYSVAMSYPIICDPMGCSLPGSSVQGISQTRIQEWVAISFSRGSSLPGIQPASPSLAGRLFTAEPPGKPHAPKSPEFRGEANKVKADLQLIYSKRGGITHLLLEVFQKCHSIWQV